jgi:hypothetical protein
MAITKQQEMIVGVGVLALLGYFALRTPEKPLEAAPGHTRPTDPGPGIPIEIKKDTDVEKKAKLYDNLAAQTQYIANAVGAFGVQFNQYCLVRQQARESYIRRIQELKQSGRPVFPLTDFMRKDIENLVTMARDLQRVAEDPGQNGLRGLNLNRQQSEMVRNVGYCDEHRPCSVRTISPRRCRRRA